MVAKKTTAKKTAPKKATTKKTPKKAPKTEAQGRTPKTKVKPYSQSKAKANSKAAKKPAAKKPAAKKTVAKKTVAKKTVAKPAEKKPVAKKDGLRKAQLKVLQTLDGRKNGLTRKEIAEKAEVDNASLTEYIGSLDDAKRVANDKKHFPSLISLNYLLVGFVILNEREHPAYTITPAGKKALKAANAYE